MIVLSYGLHFFSVDAPLAQLLRRMSSGPPTPLNSHGHRGRSKKSGGHTMLEDQVRTSRHSSPPAGTKCLVTKEQRIQSCVDQVDKIVAMFMFMTSLTWPAAAPFYRMSKFLQTKLSQMAADPRKLQIFKPTKIKAGTVLIQARFFTKSS